MKIVNQVTCGQRPKSWGQSCDFLNDPKILARGICSPYKVPAGETCFLFWSPSRLVRVEQEEQQKSGGPWAACRNYQVSRGRQVKGTLELNMLGSNFWEASDNDFTHRKLLCIHQAISNEGDVPIKKEERKPEGRTRATWTRVLIFQQLGGCLNLFRMQGRVTCLRNGFGGCKHD